MTHGRTHMLAKQPTFLENREWYTTPADEGMDDMFFPDGRGYHIREDAPEEAKQSYQESYCPEEMIGEDGKPVRKEGMSANY